MTWKQRAAFRRDVRRGVIDLREHARAIKRRREFTVPVEIRNVGGLVRFVPGMGEWRRFRCYRTVDEAERAVERLRIKNDSAEYRVIRPGSATVAEFPTK